MVVLKLKIVILRNTAWIVVKSISYLFLSLSLWALGCCQASSLFSRQGPWSGTAYIREACVILLRDLRLLKIVCELLLFHSVSGKQRTRVREKGLCIWKGPLGTISSWEILARHTHLPASSLRCLMTLHLVPGEHAGAGPVCFNSCNVPSFIIPCLSHYLCRELNVPHFFSFV